MTNTLFVSHYGDDRNNCHNWTTPCRTVRNAVKMANEGDRIFIDYANGSPYMECQNLTQTRYSMGLTKSLSFYGINGKAEIRCTRKYGLFNISSPSANVSRVKFYNLIISNSNTAVRLAMGARSKIVFQNVHVKNNLNALYSKHSSDCFIVVINSTFQSKFLGAGIWLQCLNVTAEINSSTFRLTPALFTNIGAEPPRWQNMRVWVRGAIVDGENFQMCTDMIAIKPFAAAVNVTIFDSQIKNHVANCRNKDEISALHIYGDHHQSNTKLYLEILMSDLLVENNCNNWSTFTLDAVNTGSEEIVIRNSIFRNNSAALRLSSYDDRFHVAYGTTMILENNTFIDNSYQQSQPNGAAAIYFSRGGSRVSGCRFLDNKAGSNPYTGVVTISQRARVNFLDTYFENRQTNMQSNQLFALGNEPLSFSGNTTINLVALKEKQSVFIHIPTAISAGVTVSRNFKILCPQGYKLSQKRFCVIKNSKVNVCYYINVQCERCPTNTYTLERGQLVFNRTNNIQCDQCPRGGDCNSGLIKAKPNFWGYKSKMKIHFIQCPPGYCCETKDCATYDSCHGNRSGILCGQCPQGMSEALFSTKCISNTKCSLNYLFICGISGFIVLYLAFFLYHREIVNFLRTSLFPKRLSFFFSRRTDHGNNHNANSNTSSSGGIMKIFFYYYQVCRLVRESVGPSRRAGIITSSENAISRTMNMVLVNIPYFDCPLGILSPISKALILHSVGYCLLGLLCVLYVSSEVYVMCRNRERNRTASLQHITTRSNNRSSASRSSFFLRMISGFTYITLVMYASLAQLCLSLLHCVPFRGDQVLFLNGSIKCYQPFQYFLLAYLITSIIPFCLVPVLGSYLLQFHQIGVKQFCVACIFPLPFCCFWMYLVLKNCRCGNLGTVNIIHDDNDVGDEHESNNTESLTDRNDGTSTILNVLLGPFRPHQAFICFPASRIPWEGFLIFRRLVLILVLTFVYDIQLKLFLALTLCVAILIVHTIVYPFQRKRDNVLETLSLGTHVVLCALNLIKALYYGEDDSFQNRFPALGVFESVLVVAPLSVVIIAGIICILVKFAFILKFFVSLLIRRTGRLLRLNM